MQTHTGADIIMPTITHGGNTGDSLMDMTMAARRQLQNARDAMVRAGDLADGRNHAGGIAAAVARQQHAARLATIAALIAEMDAVAEYIADSGCL